MNDQRYTVDKLHEELRRFERELRVAGLKETSVKVTDWHDGGHSEGPCDGYRAAELARCGLTRAAIAEASAR